MPPTRTSATGSSRLTASVVAAELGRLTPRDRLLLDLLDQHRTFTTDQLVDLAFGSVGRARNRLNTLHDRDILDRFRHYQRPGSQAWRWTLGPVGAALIAAGRGEALPRPAVVRDATARLAMSPTLAHLLTVNGFFVALTAHARTHPGARLVRWWNEARCREACGNLVRPDGHGVWSDNGRAVPFWVEADLGTETLSRVVGKLTGYAALPPRRAYPVLFWLPTTARETNLHAYLRRAGVPDGVTVATTAADHAAEPGPAGPVWRIVGHHDRVSMADLPAPRGDGGAPWDG
ncbi:replication-relaxation family protein [Micromonospora sp. RL09-050-HVF-A]|uniref:replication-relaxation family protein n=1 Tax=Micromonospora sp. RL09-050-HVF-A TaxID=1703433 RepID=UPI001C5FC7EE|nr:replication-relaxation family protein [Micromonospora sp. RL09-050-HVF-A]MBW4704601.1 replication-relaxation family protein [Micromonospora sp. RL09-050-HVF-A]